jgi:hypothetical protein
MKTEWYRHKNRYEDQWNRIEDPYMYPHSYAHPSFDKGTKTYNGKYTAYSTSVAGKSGYMTAEN